MAQYKVTYEHDVKHTYEAIVEADSVEEALRKADEGDFISEKEIDWQGIEIRYEEPELL